MPTYPQSYKLRIFLKSDGRPHFSLRGAATRVAQRRYRLDGSPVGHLYPRTGERRPRPQLIVHANAENRTVPLRAHDVLTPPINLLSKAGTEVILLPTILPLLKRSYQP